MLGSNEGFAGFWEIAAMADFIITITRKYRVNTLHFPDNILKDATLVQAALARECRSKRGHKIEACLPVAPPPSLNVSCDGSDGEHESTKCTYEAHVKQAFVMADTTYNSMGADEVAAQHVQWMQRSFYFYF